MVGVLVIRREGAWIGAYKILFLTLEKIGRDSAEGKES